MPPDGTSVRNHDTVHAFPLDNPPVPPPVIVRAPLAPTVSSGYRVAGRRTSFTKLIVRVAVTKRCAAPGRSLGHCSS